MRSVGHGQVRHAAWGPQETSMVGQHAQWGSGVGVVLIVNGRQSHGGHLAAQMSIHQLGVRLVRGVLGPSHPYHVQGGQQLGLGLRGGR